MRVGGRNSEVPLTLATTSRRSSTLRWPRAFRLLLALAATAGCAWLAAVALAPVLPTPPLTSLRELQTWLHSTAPMIAAATTLRLLCLPATLLVAIALAVTALHRSGGRARGIGAHIAWILPTPVLGMAAMVLGTTGCVTSSTGNTATTHGHRPPIQATVTMSPLTLSAVSSQQSLPVETSAPTPAPTQATGPPVAPPPSASAKWRVRAGDSFWVIAEEIVRQHGGNAADPASVADYWVSLVRANLTSIPDRSNPSLIYPDTILRLPPYPP